jgi:hypothetical protein
MAKTKEIYRDSGTGKFTTKADVKRRPGRTETETVKVGKPKKK